MAAKAATPLPVTATDPVPFRPPMNSDLQAPHQPITSLHIERARKQLSKAGKDSEIKSLIKIVLALDAEFCAVDKQAEQFGRNASRARWYLDMAAAVAKADGREVQKKPDFIESQLRRMRPLRARLGEITKEAAPTVIDLYQLLIVAFGELEKERVEEEKAFAGGEDFALSALLQAYRYARQTYFPALIRRLKETPGTRRPKHLLLGLQN